VGETLSFDGSGSSDSDGRIVGYAWNLGDGIITSGITVTHVYTQVGSYQVALTVTDDGGLTGESTHLLTITEAPVAERSYGLCRVACSN
jgi:PKD repeat protein